jgi:PQQ system protein
MLLWRGRSSGPMQASLWRLEVYTNFSAGVLVHQGARVRVHLSNPGLYSFSCPVSNHAGRGMFGVILVKGDVPPEARLDRPKQPRP